MNAKLVSLLGALILCLASVQAASFDVRDIKVSVTYPAPYDRFSDRIDSDDGLLNGDSIQADIFPGSNVEFTFFVEDLLRETDGYDGDISNVFGTIKIKDLDDGDNVEVETDESDLNAGDDVKLRATIPIPVKVEAQEYDVEIKVEGDVNGTTETTTINLILEVKKESSDLKVTQYRVSPSTISCERTILLNAVMTNLGKNEEEGAAFEARSDQLGISIKNTGITLSEDPFDSDSEYVFNMPFIVSKTVKPGTYTIAFNAWFKNQIVMDKRTVEIIVLPCASSLPVQEITSVQNDTNFETQVGAPPKSQPTSNDGNQQSLGTQPSESASSQESIVTSSTEKPITSSPYFIAIAILLNLAVIIVLIYAGAKAVSARKQKDSVLSKKQDEVDNE